MALLKIEMLGSDVLRARAAEIDQVDDELRRLADDMLETMYDAEGIGLAGPQIGVSRRIVVIDLQDEETDPLVLINPRIVESGQKREKGEEGCLSIPGLAGAVERPGRVVVEATNLDGERVRLETEGLLSRCLQHEIDHLDGVLFIDHLSPLKRSMLLKKWQKRAGAEQSRAAR